MSQLSLFEIPPPVSFGYRETVGNEDGCIYCQSSTWIDEDGKSVLTCIRPNFRAIVQKDHRCVAFCLKDFTP